LDPGWKPAVSPRLLVPFLIQYRGLGKRTMLVTLRAVWLSMLLSWLLFGIVLLFNRPENTHRPAWVLPFVAGWGLYSVLVSLWFRDKMAHASREDSFPKAYASLSFINSAFANSAVLMGFVGFFVGGGMASYLLGVPFGLIIFFLQAPTARNVSRTQRIARERGSAITVLDELSGPYQRPAVARRKGSASPRSPEPPSGPAQG
jgi:hypothetical protein